MYQQPWFSEAYQNASRQALQLALQTAPAYQSWQALDSGTASPLDARFAALPVLSKQMMRECFPDGLVLEHRNVAEGLARQEIEYVATSGTTEEKVMNLWNQKWWNASEAASWQLNTHTQQLNHNLPEAQLASALSVGFRSEDDLPMEKRLLGRYLFLSEKASALELTDRHYARMARELEVFQPVVLEANPSLLARLAWWALDHEVVLYQPRVILLTYEFSSALHLRDIQRVFRTPLVSSFGSTETGYVFMQCECGNFHQNTEFCRVDFQPLKHQPGGPAVGRILVSTFNNPWAGILRFDVGDLVRLAPPVCACGRTEGYILSAIEGRAANMMFTTQGDCVTTKALDDVLLRIDGIRDYQLVQQSREEYWLQLKLVPPAPHLLLAQTQELLHGLFGAPARISIELVAEIAPAASGKYRRTSSNIPVEMKGLFT